MNRTASALVAMFVFARVAMPAAGQPVMHSSLKAASDAAAADQSLVLLVFSAEWCGPCKLLKSRTLESPEFLRQTNLLHLADVDIDANQKMAQDFAVEAVPTLVLLTPDGKIIQRQAGFMETADLLAWLKTGRIRMAAGQWEGTTPTAQFDELIKQAAADNLGTNDLQRLMKLLGDTDPANREQAGKILLAQRERAVPLLIEAVENPYLGMRISAGELLQRLAPDVPPVDPWQSPPEMSNTVIALKKWWAATGKLPPVSTVAPANAFSTGAVKEALDQLRGDDPVRRTAAMTTLVRFGPDALPAVREAIRRAEKNGDQRALGLLEDVRWTILVPDAVEQQSGGIRNVLARGKSSERQAAVEHLGRIGRPALDILAELAGDADPLVVEGTVRALAGIKGEDVIPALAVLLKSPDNNLRMTAAQALGHTKNPEAVKPLLSVLTDPDEVVACTALSALEETQSRDSYSPGRSGLPEEIIAGLIRCTVDPRWRVRAAAAEVAGKLRAQNVTPELKKLLDDPDGFVVKNALTALGQLGSAPDATQLSALGKRLPSLQGDTVEIMLRTESDEVAKSITKLFKSGSPDTQVAILNALANREVNDESQTDDRWEPMVKQAVEAKDPVLRRAAAEVLVQRSPKLAAKLVGPLLPDEDSETRHAAARVILRILDHDSDGTAFSRTYYSSSSTKKTKPAATAAQLAGWHAALLRRVEPVPALSLAAAIFLTGDGKADLPLLLKALSRTNSATMEGRSQKQTEMAAIGLLVQKLTLAEGRPVLEKLCASPVWFALAARQNGRCKPEVADFLLDPARFKGALEPASGPELSQVFELLAGYDYEYRENKTWSFWTETDRTKAVALALLDSTNAGWRAASVFSLGLRADAKDQLAVFEKAVADPDPWVRDSACKALTRNIKDHATREQHLGPLLTDTNLQVAATAALGLLEPEVREAAGFESDLDYFRYESNTGGRSQSHSVNNDRPLTALNSKPGFLPAARERMSTDDPQKSASFALLLAQYGEFDGVDQMAARWAALVSENNRNDLEPLLAGITLSRDAKYLPVLKQISAMQSNEYELRKILQAMRGMAGRDARQLRLDINKKIRSVGGTTSSLD